MKEGESQGQYFVTIRAKVSVDQIGEDFKQLLGLMKIINATEQGDKKDEFPKVDNSGLQKNRLAKLVNKGSIQAR